MSARISVFSFILSFSFSQALLAQSLPGKALYQEYCQQCHGDDATGGNASSIFDDRWSFGGRANDVKRTIRFGIPDAGMPAYGEALTNAQVDLIYSYITTAVPAVPDEQPADLLTLDYELSMEVLGEGLKEPWGMAFLGNGQILVTEKPGNLRLIENGQLMAPILGTPRVLYERQGGLMDVAVAPSYPQDGWVYLSYSHEIPNPAGGNSLAMTRIVRGKINEGKWTGQQVLFEAPHDTYRTTRHHYGSRIVFDGKGHLYFSIGDRGADDHAQEPARPNGKIHRIKLDGSIPKDNPFVNEKGAMPSVFAIGCRNPQGLAVHPYTSELWEAEHGPMGGDEVNVIKAGHNYGWPVITYGRNYNGTVITDTVRKEGLEQPVLYWNPSIAVCGIGFYQGDEFPKWDGHLLVAALKYEEVQLHRVYKDRIQHTETILKNIGRVRDVSAGPDGAIYVVTNSPDRILVLKNKK